ncbi:tyrosyl-tRNA synthetase [Candidatus Magnetobacterium bavaricum]|uniref:Tyrosine--tRNA ligase n=1 Tax=Candidatus Magnetobacterium bavaricum TaxID=29290 RepID=A0A0F3GW69_9BACT|nr:tyrosyl-tRNA synthetase [Candidatus Magnetobacterium bavaricum]
MLAPQEQLEVIKRGASDIIHEAELLEKLRLGRPLRIKAGFDPTAPDIHLGHTVLIEKMRQLQELGHEVTFLIGDFTGMIGDPSGKNELRKPLTSEEVSQNAATYRQQIFKILSADKTHVRFNSEWFSAMSGMEIIRLGAMQTVARVLERDDFKKRFENHNDITLLEFYYPLFQAYDSVHLKADVELGGSDQRFNLLMGRTIQRRFNQHEQVVIMMPLLEGLDGVNKMSKSLGNYIGINEPPKEIYGKLMSTTDELMLRYYELLSHISVGQLNELKRGIADGSVHPKKAKEDLAVEITARFHGMTDALRVQQEFDLVFKSGQLPQEIEERCITWTADQMWVPQIMKDAGLATSTGEAMRLIKQGGVVIDDTKVTDTKATMTQGQYLFKVGKRRFLKISPK